MKARESPNFITLLEDARKARAVEVSGSKADTRSMRHAARVRRGLAACGGVVAVAIGQQHKLDGLNGYTSTPL
jgi:hypothetical protein